MLGITMRILTFRATREELLSLRGRHLAFGLFCTWIVGMGRFWDNPRAGLLQHLGLGSLAYVFVLAAFLWLLTAPLRPDDWSFARLLTFVTLVSPPAILYALPFQYWMPMYAASDANTTLLALVAAWRMALLFWFLRRAGRLSFLATSVGGVFPVLVIIVVLGLLNVDRVAFNIMRGVEDATPNDGAYASLVQLMSLANRAFVPLLVAWLIAVGIASTKARANKKRD